MTQNQHADDIPANVRQFIFDHISSLEQLEVLRFLQSQPRQSWSAEDVAQKLYLHAESAASRLADLERRGLAERDAGKPIRYRYAPASSVLDQAVSLLARLYKERHVTIINLIYSKPVDHVRSFAEAFKLKKED